MDRDHEQHANDHGEADHFDGRFPLFFPKTVRLVIQAYLPPLRVRDHEPALRVFDQLVCRLWVDLNIIDGYFGGETPVRYAGQFHRGQGIRMRHTLPFRAQYEHGVEYRKVCTQVIPDKKDRVHSPLLRFGDLVTVAKPAVASIYADGILIFLVRRRAGKDRDAVLRADGKAGRELIQFGSSCKG